MEGEDFVGEDFTAQCPRGGVHNGTIFGKGVSLNFNYLMPV